MFGVKVFYKWANAIAKFEKQSLIAQRTVSAGVSKEDDILKLDIKNKWFSDVKQSWRFVKTAQEERRLLGKNVGKKEKEIVKNINYIPSPKKIALESASKLADANDLYPINFFIYIYIYISLPSTVLTLRWCYVAVWCNV